MAGAFELDLEFERSANFFMQPTQRGDHETTAQVQPWTFPSETFPCHQISPAQSQQLPLFPNEQRFPLISRDDVRMTDNTAPASRLPDVSVLMNRFRESVEDNQSPSNVFGAGAARLPSRQDNQLLEAINSPHRVVQEFKWGAGQAAIGEQGAQISHDSNQGDRRFVFQDDPEQRFQIAPPSFPTSLLPPKKQTKLKVQRKKQTNSDSFKSLPAAVADSFTPPNLIADLPQVQSRCTVQQTCQLPTTPLVKLPNGEGTQIAFRDILPPQAQAPFSHLQYLTKVQYAAAEILLNTDESVVVHAPTGSGKTVLFEFALLRLLQNCQKVGSGAGTLWYIGPLKAICQERLRDWTKRFLSFGIKLIELTGDSIDIDTASIASAQIVLTTPEKLDVVSRRFVNDTRSILSNIGVLCVDEIHLLGEGRRGACLEAVVSRLRAHSVRLQEQGFNCPISHLRVVAASATVPNADEVAQWLNARALTFPEDDRPVPLRYVFEGVYRGQKQSDYLFCNSVLRQVPQVVHRYSDGRAAIVFCSTRNHAEQVARELHHQAMQYYPGTRMWPSFNSPPGRDVRLGTLAGSVQNAALSAYIHSGVAYHHAGLDRVRREMIEDSFRHGDIAVLCSTTTLSQGVNLPARLVVIAGTLQYRNNDDNDTIGPRRGFVDMPRSTVMQMAGRAGRPGLDSEGVCVLMTDQDRVQEYREIMTSQSVVESHLHQRLPEHLNAEAVLDAITSVADAHRWLNLSFLAVRVRTQPEHYIDQQTLANIGREGLNPSQWFVQSRLEDALQRLSEANVIVLQGPIKERESRILPTPLGQCMCRQFVSFDTVQLWANRITPVDNMEHMLFRLCECVEFEDMSARVDERKILNGWNSSPWVRYRYPKSLMTGALKAQLLLQAVFAGQRLDKFSLDLNTILQTVPRLSVCLAEVAASKMYFKPTIESLRLAACCVGRCWPALPSLVTVTDAIPDDSPMRGRPLQQIVGVGPAIAERVAQMGIISLSDALCQIDQLRSLGVSEQGIKQLEGLPTCSLTIRHQSGSQVVVDYDVSLAQGVPRSKQYVGRDYFTLVIGVGERLCGKYHINKPSGQVTLTAQRWATDSERDPVVAVLIHSWYPGIEIRSQCTIPGGAIVANDQPELRGEAQRLLSERKGGRKQKMKEKTKTTALPPPQTASVDPPSAGLPPPLPRREPPLPPPPTSTQDSLRQSVPVPGIQHGQLAKATQEYNGFSFVAPERAVDPFEFGQAIDNSQQPPVIQPRIPGPPPLPITPQPPMMQPPAPSSQYNASSVLSQLIEIVQSAGPEVISSLLSQLQNRS